MGDIVYDTDALEQARTVLAGEAARTPGLGDLLAAMPGPDLGRLDASRAVGDAMATLTRALVAELEAAGQRLREAEKALDVATHRVQGTDRAGAAALAPTGS
ncbi:hypothetical protein [Actinomycetospora cinnamomea]|uniref:Uncharacterized protein n=1 Tax=Actinomycetospora cinnamomea TaxID=663609 RepID=A0A2U1ECZ8_9PSEU|nr:hypothetical protein [Actinomycetospora cinnamomea]PVY97742.1 hypothetical protein C8D89_12355 [Actinomycetospora cinnamomea]